MNTRAVCDNHSKLSVKLPQFARHEKLAFIERVCALLIESRFDNGHAEEWEHWCLSSENDLDEIICDKPRFAPPAVGYVRSNTNHVHSAAGLPALACGATRASPRLNHPDSWDAFAHGCGSPETATHPARGSPD
jgi:hypothetical protein